MKKKIDFEKSLHDLENLVTQMEKGDLSLEDALNQYEAGMKLLKTCQKILDTTEQKIHLISEKNNVIEENDFN